MSETRAGSNFVSAIFRSAWKPVTPATPPPSSETVKPPGRVVMMTRFAPARMEFWNSSASISSALFLNMRLTLPRTLVALTSFPTGRALSSAVGRRLRSQSPSIFIVVKLRLFIGMVCMGASSGIGAGCVARASRVAARANFLAGSTGRA